jgi:hypothetical protein
MPQAGGTKKMTRDIVQVQPQNHAMKLRPRQCKSNGDDRNGGDLTNTHSSKVSNGKEKGSSLSHNAIERQKEQPVLKGKNISGDHVTKASINDEKQPQPGGSSMLGAAGGSKRQDTRKNTRIGVEVIEKGAATGYNCQGRNGINPGRAAEDDDSNWIKPVTPKEWALAQKDDCVLGKLVDLKIEFGSKKIPKAVLSTLSANTRVILLIFLFEHKGCTQLWCGREKFIMHA